MKKEKKKTDKEISLNETLYTMIKSRKISFDKLCNIVLIIYLIIYTFYAII